MLAGSLGTFGFAQGSLAAHELEVELARLDTAPAKTQPQRAVTLANLLGELRNDLESGSEQQRPSHQQPGDQQSHEHLAHEQAAFVAPVA